MSIKRIETKLSKTLDFRYVDENESSNGKSTFCLDRLSENGFSFNIKEAKALKEVLDKILSIVSDGES
jgi:hypothetical protein